jgi:lipopolysaccharide export system protein LptA
MHLKTLLATLLTCASLGAVNAHSLDSDANAEITIQSDRAEFDRKTGIAIYIGSVILEQGSLLITADQITLFSDEEQRLNKAVAEGKPAHFQQLMEGDKGLTKAKGHNITYLTLEKSISLSKEAELKQEGNAFSGNHIIYNMDNESVSAKGQAETQVSPKGEEQPSGRIKMIIQPAKPAENTTDEDA